MCTMHYPTLSILVSLLLLPGLACAQRRGGRGGGGGGDHGDDFDGDDNGSDNDVGGGGGDGGDTVFPTKPCGWHERQKTFGLPGIYYNGSITIRHRITENTAWLEEPEDELDVGCDNDDGSLKIYTYPALLLIAPTGNDSDTNPMHWALRAFQPADQVRGPHGGFVDIAQRWVYIRSSDFIVRNETLRDPDNSALWSLLDTWRDSDATRLNQDTQVYWPTNITSREGGVYAARAEYTRTPPEIKEGDYKLSLRKYGKYTSQFITLSDVCVWNQRRTSINDAPEGMPRSDIYQGDSNVRTSTPTIWLARGATAELMDIGAESMTMTLNNSLIAAVPRSSGREAGCQGSDPDPFEMGHFGLVHSSDGTSSDPRPWNLTLSISISFQGSIVRENSTTINGFENGKLVFGKSYDGLLMEQGGIKEEEDDDSTGTALGRNLQGLVGVVFCFMLGIIV